MSVSFSRREVERSFRKFRDLTNDLQQSVCQTWLESFNHLIHHCENDPVMAAVTQPLRDNKSVSAHDWFETTIKNRARGMRSGASYTLPTNDDDRTALLYQFFLKIYRKEVEVINFCLNVFGSSNNIITGLQIFSRELVEKFTREVSYRLAEIQEDIGNEQEVPISAMYVFHSHNHTTNFNAPVNNSAIATGESTVSGVSISINSGVDFAESLRQLTALTSDLAEQNRVTIVAAIEQLAKAAESGSSDSDNKHAADLVANASPELRAKLIELSKKVGLSLFSSGVFLAIKTALGFS